MSSAEGVFHFELNESLYFDSGQKVAEIIGVSLDPEIAIQSFHEYISIRGVIELSGDYHKVPLSSTLDKPPHEMDDIHDKNFIEQVIDKTDSLASFTHRFPVEISVPAYRINDLEEVTVQVASFDYEIPNHHQMKLMAIIEIEGINEEVEAPTHEEQPVTPPEEEAEEMEKAVEVEETEEAEEKSAEGDESPLTEAGEADTNMEESSPENMTEVPQEQEEAESETEKQGSEKKEQKKAKKSLPLSDFFKKEERISTEEKETSTEISEEAEMVDNEETEETIKTNESSRESDHNSTPINSLSEMFEHDKQEEYAKMRLCIVQDSDTIEKIAERYETTSNQLLLKNRLSDDESITEGQLLYIPEKVEK